MTTFSPLDLRCRVCTAPPGQRCRSLLNGKPRRPHADRVTDARGSAPRD